jgi:hypothetical protein
VQGRHGEDGIRVEYRHEAVQPNLALVVFDVAFQLILLHLLVLGSLELWEF